MKTIKKQKILSEIFAKKKQLQELQPYIHASKVSNDFYNKILIEKAILQKKLKDMSETSLSKFVKSLFKPKSKMISDYFKENCSML